MITIKQILGYDTVNSIIDLKGRDYLKVANNPGSILAANGILVVSSDNTTIPQEIADKIEKVIRNTSLKTFENVKIKP